MPRQTPHVTALPRPMSRRQDLLSLAAFVLGISIYIYIYTFFSSKTHKIDTNRNTFTLFHHEELSETRPPDMGVDRRQVSFSWASPTAGDAERGVVAGVKPRGSRIGVDVECFSSDGLRPEPPVPQGLRPPVVTTSPGSSWVRPGSNELSSSRLRCLGPGSDPYSIARPCLLTVRERLQK